jgi:hypothetical protein
VLFVDTREHELKARVVLFMGGMVFVEAREYERQIGPRARHYDPPPPPLFSLGKHTNPIAG